MPTRSWPHLARSPALLLPAPVRGLGGPGTHLAGCQPRAGPAGAGSPDRFADGRGPPGPRVPAPASEPPGLLLRLRGLLGIVAILAIAIASVAQPEANPLAGGGLGSRSPAAVRDLRAPDSRRPTAVPRARQLRDLHPQLLVCRLAVRLRRAGQTRLEPGGHLRVSAAACHHLRQRALCHHVLPRDHAAHRAGVRHPDEPGDGSQRGREPERGGLDLHGSDRGPADHPPVSRRG